VRGDADQIGNAPAEAFLQFARGRVNLADRLPGGGSVSAGFGWFHSWGPQERETAMTMPGEIAKPILAGGAQPRSGWFRFWGRSKNLNSPDLSDWK
jgi:hypothetical protein